MQITQITLATEQQWQRAAQGDDRRSYPWGYEFDERKANTWESGIHKPTQVTKYPQGVSPYGVLDMSGNVWEWCLTSYESGRNDLQGTDVLVLRGGSFGDDENFAAASYRHSNNPSSGFNYVGFRLVVAPL